MVKNRHMGKFSIPMKIINDSPSDVLPIMDGMLIIKADWNPMTDKIDYIGVAPKYFRGVAIGEMAPEYIFEINGKEIKAKEIN